MNKWFSLFPQGERDSFAAQAPRGAGGAGTHFAAAVFPHGADAGLHFPLRPFRRGRRLMISCREAVGAGTGGRATALRRRSGLTARSLRWRSSSKGDLIRAAFLFVPFGAGHTLRCRGSFIFLFSFYGILLHWRLHFSFWPAKIEKRSKEKSAAHVSALKNRTGHYPPRNSRAEWKSSFRVIYEYPTMNDARSDRRSG